MPSEDNYDLSVSFRVKVAKWRINDQSNEDNRKWSLWLFDEVQQKWIQTVNMNRPGEEAYVYEVVNVADM